MKFNVQESDGLADGSDLHCQHDPRYIHANIEASMIFEIGEQVG